MATFGERFKSLRTEKSLTQQQLADQINSLHNLSFGKSSISLYENDKGAPELAALEKFADFFDVSVDYILGRSNIKNPNVEVYAQAFHSISTDELTQDEVDLLENMIEQFKKNRGIRK